MKHDLAPIRAITDQPSDLSDALLVLWLSAATDSQHDLGDGPEDSCPVAGVGTTYGQPHHPHRRSRARHPLHNRWSSSVVPSSGYSPRLVPTPGPVPRPGTACTIRRAEDSLSVRAATWARAGVGLAGAGAAVLWPPVRAIRTFTVEQPGHGPGSRRASA